MAANTGAFLRGARGEIEGNRRPLADTRDGAGIDLHMGTAAVLFARNSALADEMFEDLSFDTARGRFREIAELRFGETPRVDQRGTGVVVLERTGDAPGDFYAKTAIEVRVGGARRVLLLEENTPVGAEQRITLAVRSADVAPAIDGLHSGRIIDSVWDPSWRVVFVRVSEGRAAESPEEFRARKRQERLDNRRGYQEAIRRACKAAGAVHVALFEDTFVREDFGLSHCYVADGGYEASPELVTACRLAVDDAAVGGCDLWVGAMTRQRLDLRIIVKTWDPINAVNVPAARLLAEQAIRSSFEARESAFVFDPAAIAAAVQAAVPVATQRVGVTASPAPPTVATMFAQEPLPRYDLGAVHVAVERADGD